MLKIDGIADMQVVQLNMRYALHERSPRWYIRHHFIMREIQPDKSAFCRLIIFGDTNDLFFSDLKDLHGDDESA
jgi:hypothetical protein